MTPSSMVRLCQRLALLASAAVTLLFLWSLGMLNSRALSDVPIEQNVRTVVIRGPDSGRVQVEEPAEQPEPDIPQPEIMEVNLDAPAVDTLLPQPLDLELELPTPTMAAVQVSVQQPRPAPRSTPAAASRPQTKAQPDSYQANQVDHPPRETRQNPAPAYPPGKLRQGIEGTVRLRLLIDESGAVQDVEVVSGEDEFRQAVMAVVWKWRFTPARHEGRAVKVWGLKEVRFNIRQSSAR